MLNKIRWRGLLLIDVIKEGRNNFYILENGDKLRASDFRKEKVEIMCNGNNKWYSRGLQTCWLKSKFYYSNEFLTTGENNPFYGKKHSKELKERLSKERKGKWGIDKENAMYERSVVDVWKEKYPESWKEHLFSWKNSIGKATAGENNPFYGKTHTNETKEILRQKTIEFMNSERGKEICRKGGIASVTRRPQKTKIERIIEEKLSEMNVDFRYCFILDGRYQYDFLINDNTILEVQGDYWHANPDIYGEGLRPLNETQIFKVNRDKEKKVYALNKGYEIYYIWEKEIYNDNFSVLKELKNG